MARNAGAAGNPQSTGSNWLQALFGRVMRTQRTPGRHSQLTLHLVRIRRECLIADVTQAKRKKKKAPFSEVYSATHELLRRELANGRG